MQPRCVTCGINDARPKRVENGHTNRASRYCSTECRIKYSWIKASNDPKSILESLYRQAFYRAKYKDVPFTITILDLKTMWDDQEGKCAFSGQDFELGPSKTLRVPKRNSISLDRISPTLGYTKENCRLITYQVNCAKSSYTDEELIKMCEGILSKRNNNAA